MIAVACMLSNDFAEALLGPVTVSACQSYPAAAMHNRYAQDLHEISWSTWRAVLTPCGELFSKGPLSGSGRLSYKLITAISYMRIRLGLYEQVSTC